MKLWSLRSAYNNYEIIVVTASLGGDTSTFAVSSCVANGSVLGREKHYLFAGWMVLVLVQYRGWMYLLRISF